MDGFITCVACAEFGRLFPDPSCRNCLIASRQQQRLDEDREQAEVDKKRASKRALVEQQLRKKQDEERRNNNRYPVRANAAKAGVFQEGGDAVESSDDVQVKKAPKSNPKVRSFHLHLCFSVCHGDYKY